MSAVIKYSNIISTYTLPTWVSDERKDAGMTGVTSVNDKHMMAACSSLTSLSQAIGRTMPAQYPCITASLQYAHKHNCHNYTNGPSFSAKSMACLPRRGHGGTKLWHMPVLVSLSECKLDSYC